MTAPQKEQRNPWDAFPPEAAKPSTQEDIHRAVGVTCSSWSMVEHQLFMILRSLFARYRVGGAWKLYATVPTTSSIVNYIKSAADTIFVMDEERLCVLEYTLDNFAMKFSTRRNEIVHGIVFMLPNDTCL